MVEIGALATQQASRFRNILLLAATIAAGMYFIPRVVLAYGVVGATGAILLCGILAMALRGNAEIPLLAWVLLFPLGYYFLSFPRERPWVTLDRATVGICLLAACLAAEHTVTRIPGSQRRAAWAWAAFVLAILLSFVHLPSLLSPFRVAIDAFLLPPLLGWYVIRCFPVRKHLRVLHVFTCCMAFYLAGIGAAEMVLGQDLFLLPGAGEYYAGVGESLLFRPNGPFLASHSLGIVGLCSFCFLIFLRRASHSSWTRAERVLHWCGLAASVVVALLPLLRSVALTLVVIVILDALMERPKSWPLVVGGLALLLGTLLLFAWLYLPEVFAERVFNPSNLLGRMAQQQQTLDVFRQHPIIGVGFTNFSVGVDRLRGTSYFEDVAAVNSPHNTLGAMLAETGLCGFLTLIASQILFVAAFWRVRARRVASEVSGWPFFLYLFLAYWLNGLSISTIYSSDINFYYVFLTAALYKFAITGSQG